MFNDLDPKDFKSAYEASTDAVLIDVRTPPEIAETNIPGHIVMNIMEPDFAKQIAQLDREKDYYLYCRSGNRSGQACRYMASIGFKKLSNLKGGMIAWHQEF